MSAEREVGTPVAGVPRQSGRPWWHRPGVVVVVAGAVAAAGGTAAGVVARGVRSGGGPRGTDDATAGRAGGAVEAGRRAAGGEWRDTAGATARGREVVAVLATAEAGAVIVTREGEVFGLDRVGWPEYRGSLQFARDRVFAGPPPGPPPGGVGVARWRNVPGLGADGGPRGTAGAVGGGGAGRRP